MSWCSLEPLIEESGQQFGVLMGRKHHDPFATHVVNGDNTCCHGEPKDGRGVPIDGKRQQRLAAGGLVSTSVWLTPKSARPLSTSSTGLMSLPPGRIPDQSSPGTGIKPLALAM